MSLTLWTKGISITSMAIVAVCAFLLADDELNVRHARAQLRAQWQPAQSASRALIEDERSATAALAAYQAAPSPSAHARAATAVRALQDRAMRMPIPAADPDLTALDRANRTAIEAWLSQRAAPILQRGTPLAVASDPEGDMQRASGLVDRALAERATQTLATVNHTNALLRQTLLIESLLLVALLVLLVLGIRRRVLRPLLRLREDLDRSAGHLAHVITPRGPTEIAAVARDAEHMRRSLIREHDLSDQATAALEQAAPLAVAVRGELDRHDAEVPGVLGFHRPIEGVVAGDWWWAGRRADGARVLALADVSGHGVAAGMLALESRTLATAALQAGAAPVAVAEQLGRRTFRPGMFLSLFVCVVHDGTIDYCSAGHPFAAVVDAQAGAVALPPTGPVISTLGGAWHSAAVELPGHAAVVAASDGLLEPVPDADFLQLVWRAWHRAHAQTEECMEQILGQARELVGEWDDDVTVIIATPNR